MAIKFQTNAPRPLCFPYADYLEVNGQYGTQFLYTVEVEGLPVPEPEAEATEGVSAPRPEANGKPASERWKT